MKDTRKEIVLEEMSTVVDVTVEMVPSRNPYASGQSEEPAEARAALHRILHDPTRSSAR